MKKKVLKKYLNSFNYVGFSRLSHCTGENWEEVWKDPYWETKELNAKRARFIYNVIVNNCRWIVPIYVKNPIFKNGRKYKIFITQDDDSYDLTEYISVNRI